jgi:hypothetical protein
LQRRDLAYLLVNVPLTDPTGPYHSISYLVGATSAAGFTNATCVDANIEALNYMAQPEQVEDLLKLCRDVRGSIEEQPRLTRGQEWLYRHAVKAVGLQPDSVRRAIEVLQDPELFYDYGHYRHAVQILKRWMDVLSVRGFPGQFDDFTLRYRHIGNLSSVTDLTDATFVDRFVSPFAAYFNGPFTTLLRSQPWALVGLSVNYINQLPFAIYLCRYIRSVLPDCVLTVGGTEVSEDLKCLQRPADIWRLFAGCDPIIVGEGESAIVAVLDSVCEGRPLPTDHPGILRRDVSVPQASTPVNYENLTTLPPPRYDVWDLGQYWAPEPVLLYSPSRGCYWNKCTFCDYGLNSNLPTSPSRTRPIEAAIEELRAISQLARTVYFSVDAIAPAYLRKLAQAIVDNDIDIRWCAELRLERTFLHNMIGDLKKSGCVAISFGYESGSQRVLDRINKGVRLSDVPVLLAELSEAGIGAQMMGFIGFPGETSAEARATYEFLLENAEHWTIAGIGDFILTPGAIVAKRPADFGISEMQPVDGDDIGRFLCWTDTNGVLHGPGDSRGPAIDPLAVQVSRFADERPFVGGIDTNHSMLYFARYGRRLVPELSATSAVDEAEAVVRSAFYPTPLGCVEEFVGLDDFKAFHRGFLMDGRAAGFRDTLQWLADYPAEPRGGNTPAVLEIFPGGRCISLTPEQARIEQQASPAYQLARSLLFSSPV